jgi:hypothetical protein
LTRSHGGRRKATPLLCESMRPRCPGAASVD